LDFSCALFTAAGDLVVNAPHIPVHLGAMAETVRAVIADNTPIRSGDVFVTNDPYRGGSHLNDVTVVTPVHQGDRLLFFTASRAHHAELGGIAPGSMPPFSTNLAQEGVLLRNLKLFDAGAPRWESLREALVTAPYPTRDVRRTWPTSARKWPPTIAAPAICCVWSSGARWPWCKPTCNTFSTPRN
jgi:5-oxoprolinase (ATP-hydrolysing)